MKHQISWHSCDRCGKPLRKNYFFDDLFRHNVYHKLYHSELFEEEVNKVHIDKDDKREVEICLEAREKEITIELCDKCAKDFKKFMLNKL